MKRLYNLAAAGDRTGVETIIKNAKTPFQKAFAIASLVHVFIQTGQPEIAEQYAERIPESDSSSSLAKAEALSAVAVAWFRALNDHRARTDFDAAKRRVSAVTDLTFGRISVLVSIAAAQGKSKMIEDGNTTFRRAIELARELPVRRRIPAGVPRPLTPLGVHYQDEAFKLILRGAIHARSFAIASEAAEIWGRTDENAGLAVVNAWVAEGQTDAAIAAARRIQDLESRVSALLSLASDLLNGAGAPNF